jgi:hypothetical protein
MSRCPGPRERNVKVTKMPYLVEIAPSARRNLKTWKVHYILFLDLSGE